MADMNERAEEYFKSKFHLTNTECGLVWVSNLIKDLAAENQRYKEALQALKSASGE